MKYCKIYAVYFASFAKYIGGHEMTHQICWIRSRNLRRKIVGQPYCERVLQYWLYAVLLWVFVDNTTLLLQRLANIVWFGNNFHCVYTCRIMLDNFVSTCLQFSIIYWTTLSLLGQRVQTSDCRSFKQSCSNEVEWISLISECPSFSFTFQQLHNDCVLFMWL